MGDYVTSGSEYNGEESISVIVRPSLTKNLPSGLRVIETEGSSTVKKTYLGPAKHNLVAYSDGFQGGVAADRIQKKFTLGEVKSENQWSKQDFKDEVLRQMADIKRSFQNDFFQSELYMKLPGPVQNQVEGMPEEEAILNVALWRLEMRGVGIGVFNIFWLGDTDKWTESSGTFPNGTAYAKYDDDIRFNAVDGVWKNIDKVATTSPSTINEIQKIDIVADAVAQVDTLTLTGTSGTADITARGLTKLATFDTDLTTTAANFVTDHAAAYLEKGLIVTSSGADIIFTDDKKGVGFDAVTIVNVSGDLDGTRAATTANVAAGDLGTDAAVDLFNDMYDAQPEVMKDIIDSNKTFYVTRTIYENYRKSLGTDGSGKDTLESSRNAMISGINTLEFNGIKIETMAIDTAISSYFGGYSPHRAILSVNDNLSLVVSSNGEFSETARWWNKDENKVRTRTQLEEGGDYFMPELLVVAYQG